ncbi:hypothetical protein N184_13380 [Sinorhizobium sp. GL28]|nr:hypothetical protein N183_20470 [Sinorhizobium sp. Sb3]KSV83237.1 hypothetical protein N184_13380 [Sinorhizobium sp. GL28]
MIFRNRKEIGKTMLFCCTGCRIPQIAILEILV